MLAFSNDYYGMIFRATQSVELFCAYTNNMDISQIDNINKKILQYEQIELDDKTLEKWWNELLSENPSRIIDILLLLYR